VGDFSGMEVVHPLKDLLDELSGLLLTQGLLLGQEVKQLTSRDPETQTLINQLLAAAKTEQRYTAASTKL